MSDPLHDMPCPRFLLGVPVHDVPASAAVAWILEQARGTSPGFALALTASWLTHAWRHSDLQNVLRQARLVLPDSAWVPRISGFFGPRIMHGHAPSDVALQAVVAAEQAGVRVYLLAPEAEAAKAAGIGRRHARRSAAPA